MKLGKSQRTSQFLESLKAEGEVILEDVQPTASQAVMAIAPTDPVTLTIEEKLNVITKRDGGLNNFDVQGTLSLQILNQEDGFIQLQVCYISLLLSNFKKHSTLPFIFVILLNIYFQHQQYCWFHLYFHFLFLF